MAGLGQEESGHAQAPGGTSNRQPNEVVFPPFTKKFVHEARFRTLCIRLGNFLGDLEYVFIDRHHYLRVSLTEHSSAEVNYDTYIRRGCRARPRATRWKTHTRGAVDRAGRLKPPNTMCYSISQPH